MIPWPRLDAIWKRSLTANVLLYCSGRGSSAVDLTVKDRHLKPLRLRPLPVTTRWGSEHRKRLCGIAHLLFVSIVYYSAFSISIRLTRLLKDPLPNSGWNSGSNLMKRCKATFIGRKSTEKDGLFEWVEHGEQRPWNWTGEDCPIPFISRKHLGIWAEQIS